MFCAREINLPEGYRKCFNFLPYDYRNIPHSFLAQTNFKIVVEVDFIEIFLAPLMYSKEKLVVRNMFFNVDLLRRGYTVKCFFQGISWNTCFTIVLLCKLPRNVHDIHFEPFMKYENCENRFSEFSLSWKTFLLKLFSCLINSFIINAIYENLNENVNIK